MDSACAGISTTGLWAMRQALLAWEKKQGIDRPKYGRGFNYGKKTEPKEKPEPKAEKKPRAPRPSRRKYDPAWKQANKAPSNRKSDLASPA